MSNETLASENAVSAPSTPAGVAEQEVHPVLADVLSEKESDTLAWVKA